MIVSGSYRMIGIISSDVLLYELWAKRVGGRREEGFRGGSRVGGAVQ